MKVSYPHLVVSALLSIGAALLVSSVQPKLHPSGVMIEDIGWMTATGLFQGQQEYDEVTKSAAALRESGSLRGKRVLVTGTTNGLGYGIAVQLVSLGASVISASRNHKPEFMTTLLADASALAKAEGESVTDFASDAVRLVRLDLADLDSVERAAHDLADARVFLDVAILNAGVSPSGTQLTKHGFELAYGVNFVGNAAFLKHLLELKVLPEASQGLFSAQDKPRIVLVASEAHRAVPPLSESGVLDGAPRQFGVAESMLWYGHSKLSLLTYASELARRLKGKAVVDSICPGPVKSNIAHRAPWWAQPLARAYMAPFPLPIRAALPVLAVAAAPEPDESLDGARHYLMGAYKPSREDARDSAMGKAAFEAVEAMIATRGPLKTTAA